MNAPAHSILNAPDSPEVPQSDEKGNVKRLVRNLISGSDFQLLFIDCRDERYRKKILGDLTVALAVADIPTTTLLVTSEVFLAFSGLEQYLNQLAKQFRIIHIIPQSKWFSDSIWQDFNIRREAMAQTVRSRLVFWLHPDEIKRLVVQAPDIWAWRSGVYTFESNPTQPGLNEGMASERASFDNRSNEERKERIKAIQRYLLKNPTLGSDLFLPLIEELASLLHSVGEVVAALTLRQDRILPAYEKLGDKLGIAITNSLITDELQLRGDLNEALRIRRDVELPAFEQLGEQRQAAITKGKIADIFEARGQFEDAMRIRRDEELPVYEALGDVRSAAATQGQIADLHQTLGNLAEALRIRAEGTLPAYERIGDLRSVAVTKGKITDVLELRGQLEEALSMRVHEVLPIFEYLGDLHSITITKSKIADILQARGSLTDALRARKEILPIFHSLNDTHGVIVTQSKIAEILAATGHHEEALRLYREVVLPLTEKFDDSQKVEAVKRRITVLSASSEN